MSEANEINNSLSKILIVDDSRIVRATLSKNLKEYFQILEQADGEAAWEMLLKDQDIQVLISDLSMPRLDGMELLKRIRSSDIPSLKNIPVIIISGEEDDSIKMTAVQNGANDFVTKSTDKIELLSRVNAASQLAKTLRDLRATKEVSDVSATTDALTGLGTNHLLQIQGKQALSFSQRHHTFLATIILELDAFSRIQEQFGGAVSDQALVLLAKLLSSKLRKEDTIAYLGDFRFGIVSPAADYNESHSLANRLVRAIASVKINYKNNVIRVVAAAGISNTVHDFCDSIEDMLHLASKRLDEALKQGGNVVVAHDPTQVVQPTPVPVIQKAMQLLQEGKQDQVIPHLPELLRKLLPLLEFADQQLNLKLSLNQLKTILESKN